MSSESQLESTCKSCKSAIKADNPRRHCFLCSWRACRKCAPSKFCPDCKKAAMETDGVVESEED